MDDGGKEINTKEGRERERERERERKREREREDRQWDIANRGQQIIRAKGKG